MKLIRSLTALALMSVASPATAGPPYQTDDPQPTDLRHWEIYNFITFNGQRGDVDGEGGFDINYGAADGLQLTATLPLALAHTPRTGWRGGRGDVELGAKYRFVNVEKSGWQAAVFPRVILPTSAKHLGGRRTRLLLPIWVQKDFGKTSVFGGGGYEVNPGGNNRNFLQAGVAVTHDVTDRLQLGGEAAWQTADTRGGRSSRGVDLGLIDKLGGAVSLLVAAGPSFSRGQTSYHAYAGMGLNF